MDPHEIKFNRSLSQLTEITDILQRLLSDVKSLGRRMAALDERMERFELRIEERMERLELRMSASNCV